MLRDSEKEKYNRQIIIDNIGIKGQLKLKKAKVLVIGAGGLGSSILYYLSAAGIGTIGIIDSDDVEYSNLNRQILHYESDINKAKTRSAKEKLSKFNTDLQLELFKHKINNTNAETIISKYDFVIEASDNFETKFLINDICVKLEKPFTIGGVFRFEGQIMTVLPYESACYRCIFKSIPEPGSYPTTSSEGIMGTMAGFGGIIEANEALKYILYDNEEKLLIDCILYCDLEYNTFEIINVERDPDCRSCSH